MMETDTNLPENWDDTPWNRGYYASAWEGKPRDENPHSRKYEPVSHSEWDDGWKQAEHDTSWTELRSIDGGE